MTMATKSKNPVPQSNNLVEKNKLYCIEYEKADGTVTLRSIVPMTDAPKNVRAIDVTALSNDQVDALMLKQTEYRAYCQHFMAGMYDFETWFEHTQGTKLDKTLNEIRSFTVTNIKQIKEVIV
jgi:hypothetical protein